MEKEEDDEEEDVEEEDMLASGLRKERLRVVGGGGGEREGWLLGRRASMCVCVCKSLAGLRDDCSVSRESPKKYLQGRVAL